MNHEGVDGEVEEAVGRSRDDAHLPALPEGEEYQGDHLQRDGAAEGHLEEHEKSQDERQRDGDGRLGQHPGVPESVHSASSSVYTGMRRQDSRISLRRHYPDQVQRVGTSVPSQPHGSPVFLTAPSVTHRRRPRPSNPSTVAASVIPPSETMLQSLPERQLHHPYELRRLGPRTTLVPHRLAPEKVADLRAPPRARVHGGQVLQLSRPCSPSPRRAPYGPPAPAPRPASTPPLGSSSVKASSGCLHWRTSTTSPPPVTGTTAANPPLSRTPYSILRPARQLHLVHPEGAPRALVQVVPPERPPAAVFHAEEYSGSQPVLSACRESRIDSSPRLLGSEQLRC